MSITRRGPESHVYVFWTEHEDVDVLTCCGCTLGRYTGQGDPFVRTPEEMIGHLKRHIQQGDIVPDYALEVSSYLAR